MGYSRAQPQALACLWSGRRRPPYLRSTPWAASARSGMGAGLLAVAGLIGLCHWHSLRGVLVAASGGRRKPTLVPPLAHELATGICCASGGALWLEVEAPCREMPPPRSSNKLKLWPEHHSQRRATQSIFGPVSAGIGGKPLRQPRAPGPTLTQPSRGSHNLEPISKSFEEDDQAGKLDKAEEIVGVVLPADEDSALPLDPSEEALNEPPAHIAG